MNAYSPSTNDQLLRFRDAPVNLRLGNFTFHKPPLTERVVQLRPLHMMDMNLPLSFRFRDLSSLVLALLLPFIVAAQGSRNGPKLGIDIGTQTAGQFLAWYGLPKLGFIAGWSFEAPITSQVSLLIEPMYIGKGSVTTNAQYKTRGSVALNYLELPLMLKVSTNPDPQGLFISGGLMYGYFLYGKVRNYQDGNLVNAYDFSPSNNTNRSQISAALGIGHEMGHWMWELRGQSSLNTFNTLDRSHNVVYSLQIAWRFSSAAERRAALDE